MTKVEKAFLDEYVPGFEFLCAAVEANQLALLECTDKTTGAKVPCLVCITRASGGYQLRPLGVLLTAAQTENIEPPEKLEPVEGADPLELLKPS